MADLFLVFLEFGCYISLGVDECLLAYPLGGHLILIGIAYLQEIAEDAIIGNLEAGYACLFGFALLYLQQVLSTVMLHIAQVV